MASVKGQTVEQGFAKHVIRGASPDECWQWSGSTDRDGYGKFNSKGKVMCGSRASYLLHRGPIREGLQVLHRCDNRRCTNPDHLFIGDRFDNMRDAAEKGRLSTTRKSFVSLTDVDLEEIRSCDMPKRAIARKFGVAPATVRSILRTTI